MAFIGDSRSPKRGPGVLPLQAFGTTKGGQLGAPSVLACRMTDDAAKPYFKPKYQSDSVGALTRFMCWKPRAGFKTGPEWTEVIEVITVGDGTTTPSGDSDGTGNPSAPTRGSVGVAITPIDTPDNLGQGVPNPNGQGDLPPQAPGPAKSALLGGVSTVDSNTVRLANTVGGTIYGGYIIVASNDPSTPPGGGFVGYYSPSFGGWIGTFPGSANGTGSFELKSAKAAAAPGKAGPDTVIIPTTLVKGAPSGASPSGGDKVTSDDGGYLVDNLFGFGDIDYTASAVPGSSVDYYGAQRGVIPYLPGWMPVKNPFNNNPGLSPAQQANTANQSPKPKPKSATAPGLGFGGVHGDNSTSTPLGFTQGGGPIGGQGALSIEPDMALSGAKVDTDVGGPRPFWNAFPVGTYGISLRLGVHDQELRDFLPTDPRLCAVHQSAGNTDCGTLVYDVRGNGTWDDYRGASLQTLVRVVRDPTGLLSMGKLAPGQTGIATPAPGNSLALNIGVTGGREGLGGFVADGVYGKTTRLGRWSVRDGGFLDVGAFNEKHHLGSDFDGSAINPCHISTMAFFTQGAINDGPLDFEDFQPNKGPQDFTYISQVHYYFDTKKLYTWPRDKPQFNEKGVWRQWASSWVGQSTAVTPSGGPPAPGRRRRPPTSDPPGGGSGPGPSTGGGGGGSTTTPGGGTGPSTGGGGGGVAITPGGSLDPGFNGGPAFGGGDGNGPITGGGAAGGGVPSDGKDTLKSVRAGNSSQVTRNRIHAVTTAELASPGLLARPQKYKEGVVDTRYATGWNNPEAVARVERQSPVTQRISAFGAQGGNTTPGTELQWDNADGDPIVGSNPWVYTQFPGASREAGGTAQGGQVILPPEVDLSDVDTAFSLGTNVPISATFFGVGPGAQFFSGSPILATGGVRDGYTWGADSTNLMFRKVDTDGTSTDYMALNGTQSGRVFMASPADGSSGVIEARVMAVADVPAGLTAPPSSVVGGTAFDLGGNKLDNLGAPTSANDAATKAYVDNMAAGLSWKDPVVAATTAAGTLATSFANGQVVDGVTLATGDRVLIKNQATGSENGIYVVNASGTPTRSTDADSGAELVSAAVFAEKGTVNADRAFVCTNDSITIGTTAVVFVGFASIIGALLASNNLSDLTSASTARTNLGLGTLATQSGTFSGTSSGTNTGDQTITLSGDVTGSGTGSFVATIASGAVTYTKMQTMTGPALLGRTSGPGTVTEVSFAAARAALGSLLYTNSAPSTAVANTTSETVFDKFPTIVANALAAGQRIRITARGVYSTTALAPTIQARVRYGGVTGAVLINTGTISALVALASNLGWTAHIDLSFRSVGATASVEAQADLEFATAAAAAISVIPANVAPLSADTTANADLVLTVQWGTADPANSITLRDVSYELLG